MSFSKHGFYGLVISISFMMLFSCGGGDDSDHNPSSKLIPGSWQLGNISYRRGISIQETSKPDPNGPILRTFVISTTGSANQGPFSGSSISGYLYELGEGEYKTVSEDFFFKEGHSGKFITFTCNTGTAVSTGSTIYETTNSQEIVKVSFSNSDFIFHVEEDIILKKGLDVNGGVSGAKQEYPFKANSIF